MSRAVEILKQYWGHQDFRPGQSDIINSVIAGNDTLALLPTGGGKSICFQVPALVMEGLCLVVSPLIALMQDQVENLRKRGINAAMVNSSMHPREIDNILDNCIYGDIKFLYLSPERLRNELFLERLKKMKPCLIAVDEAHCISQWGYDFRPDYLSIAAIRPLHPATPILALTASATPAVVTDIQEKLQFSKENVKRNSFGRSNLAYHVLHDEDKENRIIDICAKMKGSAIVYCGSRFKTKELSSKLKSKGVSSTFYHAGLKHNEKDDAFRTWMSGSSRVMCATNAFGMGIDKPDVRFVIHADVPSSPEAYFQEAGRAGRDGIKAHAVLLYNQADIIQLEKQWSQRFPSKEFIRRIYRLAGSDLQIAPGHGKDIPHLFDPVIFSRKHDLKPTDVLPALRILELAGYISLTDTSSYVSRLHFLVKRQDLYSLQVGNPQFDPLVKVLLRMYGGLFEQYVNIREEDIAANLKVTRESVVNLLQGMHKLGVMDYTPGSELPRLTFLTGRLHEDSIVLAPEVYELRKKNEKERIASISRYLEKKVCRSIQLLEYFGEKSGPCGQCDVCRESANHGLAPAEYEKMNRAVMDLALTKALTIEEIPQSLPQFSSDHLVEYIRWKLDRGELELDDRLRLTIPGMENE